MDFVRSDDAEQLPACGGDEAVRQSVTPKLFQCVVDAHVGPDRSGRGNHQSGDRSVAGKSRRGVLDQTQHDVAVTDNDHRWPAIGKRADVGNRRPEADGSHGSDELGDAPTIADLALGRQVEHGPRGATSDECEDLAEPVQLETTRGPLTEVSMLIEAVHDDGAVGIQVGHRIAVHRLQWTVHRSGQVLLPVDRFRQHVDQLRAAIHQPARSVDVDPLHTRCVPVRSRCETTVWNRRGLGITRP